jgi:parvulin-like peptidyl-prolyl isomerase
MIVLACRKAGALLLAFAVPLAFAQGTAPTAAADPHATGAALPFAIVGKTVISTADFDVAFAAALRRRFYHAKVPDAQLAQLRREVGDELIDRVLLSEEARRRGVEPDRTAIKAQIDEYERRYASSPQWTRIKTDVLPVLTAELELRSRLARIEAEVRSVQPPPESVLREFYSQRPDAFTEPEQIRLSVILLRVDPAAPRAAWDGAREEAAAIRARILRGVDFAELARLHSADASAANGGDMGYQHRGMLPESMQAKLDKLGLGEVSEPITALEGVVLMRIADRKSGQLRDFTAVRERAQQLWQREEGDRAWRSYLAQLRSQSRVEIVDPSRYPPQSAAAVAGAVASSSLPETSLVAK